MKIVGVIPEHILRLMPKEDREPLGKAGMTATEIDDANAVKLEKKLHEQICQYLNMRGTAYLHARMDKRNTMTVGWPDFTFCVNGRPIAVEAKRPGGRLSPEQVQKMIELEKDGWRYIIAYRLEQVIELFKTQETK